MFRRQFFRVTLGILCTWLLAHPEVACTQEKPNVFVLSVGVDRYQKPTPNLKGCVGDAVGMAKVFKAQEANRFNKVETLLLADEKATAKSIEMAMKNLETRGKQGDWFVLLLSGHGGIQNGIWNFLAHDNRHVSDRALLETADRLATGGKQVAIIIDACHAGLLRYAAGPYLNRFQEPGKGGIIVMVSSMPEQLSTALGPYSAFARAVEEGLAGAADLNDDSVVTLQELRRFTYNRVSELCLQRRAFPGVTVAFQDSAIDASLSLSENTPLTHGKRPAPTMPPDDGPEARSPHLLERTWKVMTPGSPITPPAIFELRLDPFGYYRAAVKQGILPASLATGSYKVHEKVLLLRHAQGTDRVEVLSVAPTEFRFRFRGREFLARSEAIPPDLLLVDVSGRLSQEDPRDRVRTTSPHKVHSVKLEAGITYLIDLQSPEFDAYLRLENAAGSQVAEDDDSGGGRNARIRYAPTSSGEFRVIVTTYGGGYGAYHLHVEKTTGPRPPDRPSLGTPIFTRNEELSATDPKDTVRRDSHARRYDLELKAGVKYTIDLVSSDFDTFLRLEDDAAKEIAFDDDGGEGLNARLTFTPTLSARFTIVATSYRPATGRFSLTVRMPGVVPASGTEAMPLALKDGMAQVNAELKATDSFDAVRRGCYQKAYLIHLEAGTQYVVNLKSKAFDAYLRLEDEGRKELAINDDAEPPLRDARLSFTPATPGRYRIVVTTFADQEMGPFSLTVEARRP